MRMLEQYVFAPTTAKKEEIIKETLPGSESHTYLSYMHEINKLGTLMELESEFSTDSEGLKKEIKSREKKLKKMQKDLKALARTNDFNEITDALAFRMDLKALELASSKDRRLSACKNLHTKYFSNFVFGYDRLKNDLQVSQLHF